jgi:hypothetical protein
MKTACCPNVKHLKNKCGTCQQVWWCPGSRMTWKVGYGSEKYCFGSDTLIIPHSRFPYPDPYRIRIHRTNGSGSAYEILNTDPDPRLQIYLNFEKRKWKTPEIFPFSFFHDIKPTKLLFNSLVSFKIKQFGEKVENLKPVKSVLFPFSQYEDKKYFVGSLVLLKQVLRIRNY